MLYTRNASDNVVYHDTELQVECAQNVNCYAASPSTSSQPNAVNLCLNTYEQKWTTISEKLFRIEEGRKV